MKLGQPATAADHARAALAAQESGDHQTTGRANYWLGMALEALGDHRKAITCWEEALELLRQIGSPDADFAAAALARLAANRADGSGPVDLL
jgi:tetratricopeptide (TPR) repeat protein